MARIFFIMFFTFLSLGTFAQDLKNEGEISDRYLIKLKEGWGAGLHSCGETSKGLLTCQSELPIQSVECFIDQIELPSKLLDPHRFACHLEGTFSELSLRLKSGRGDVSLWFVKKVSREEQEIYYAKELKFKNQIQSSLLGYEVSIQALMRSQDQDLFLVSPLTTQWNLGGRFFGRFYQDLSFLWDPKDFQLKEWSLGFHSYPIQYEAHSLGAAMYYGQSSLTQITLKLFTAKALYLFQSSKVFSHEGTFQSSYPQIQKQSGAYLAAYEVKWRPSGGPWLFSLFLAYEWNRWEDPRYINLFGEAAYEKRQFLGRLGVAWSSL